LEIHRRMLLIRCFEMKTLGHCSERLNRGPLHVYVGEEAVAVGACFALDKGDCITSTHRGHGHCIAMGGDVKRKGTDLTIVAYSKMVLDALEAAGERENRIIPDSDTIGEPRSFQVKLLYDKYLDNY